MRRCRECSHWGPKESDPNALEGFCGYSPPPVVRHIYGLAQAEPATHIHWESQLAGPFVTQANFGCSEYSPQPNNCKDVVEEMALALYDHFSEDRKTPVSKDVCIQMAKAALKVLGERFTQQK